jgi:hypothetical protein
MEKVSPEQAFPFFAFFYCCCCSLVCSAPRIFHLTTSVTGMLFSVDNGPQHIKNYISLQRLRLSGVSAHNIFLLALMEI